MGVRLEQRNQNTLDNPPKLPSTPGAGQDGQALKWDDGTEAFVWFTPSGGGGGSGDVVGPASSTDNAISRFDSTTGKLLQDSAVTVDDNGAVTVPEITAPGTPASGKVVIYAKTDNKLYIKDDTGAETDLTATGSGTLDHASLTSNLPWLTSGHTGTNGKAAGFAGGAAAELDIVDLPNSGRRWEIWMPYGAAHRSNMNYSPSAGGARSAVFDSDGTWVEYKTGNSGAFATWLTYPNDDFCETQNDPTLSFCVKLGADIDEYRFWMVWSGDPGSSAWDAEDPANQKYAGVRFNPTDGDTVFVACVDDGTTRVKTNTGVTPVVDTVYFIEVIVDQAAGTSLVRIKAGLGGSWDETTISTNIPTSTERLAPMFRMYADNGSNRRVFRMRNIYMSSE